VSNSGLLWTIIQMFNVKPYTALVQSNFWQMDDLRRIYYVMICFDLDCVRPPALIYDVTLELQVRHDHCWLRLRDEGLGILQFHV
jgi:hypothetical protein